MADVVEKFGNNDGNASFRNSNSTELKKNRNKAGHRRAQDCVVRDFVTALALCHNVTPTYADPNDKSNVEF